MWNPLSALMGRKPPTVLVVDDAAELRQIYRAALQTRGYRVIEAADGREGYETALKERPDVILMDCNMPVLDGVQACRLIRAHPDTEKIPVVMCTSLDKVGDVEKSLEAGATDYLTKPVDLVGLRQKVERALSGFKLGVPPEPYRPPE